MKKVKSQSHTRIHSDLTWVTHCGLPIFIWFSILIEFKSSKCRSIVDFLKTMSEHNIVDKNYGVNYLKESNGGVVNLDFTGF